MQRLLFQKPFDENEARNSHSGTSKRCRRCSLSTTATTDDGFNCGLCSCPRDKYFDIFELSVSASSLYSSSKGGVYHSDIQHKRELIRRLCIRDGSDKDASLLRSRPKKQRYPTELPPYTCAYAYSVCSLRETRKNNKYPTRSGVVCAMLRYRSDQPRTGCTLRHLRRNVAIQNHSIL